MKKMTSFLALVLALSIPSGAYAAEAKLDDDNTTANGNVYAVYTEDVPWNSVPVDDDGNAVIDFPDAPAVFPEHRLRPVSDLTPQEIHPESAYRIRRYRVLFLQNYTRSEYCRALPFCLLQRDFHNTHSVFQIGIL